MATAFDVRRRGGTRRFADRSTVTFFDPAICGIAPVGRDPCAALRFNGRVRANQRYTK
ncbi:hypothetical protein BLAT2472_30714 [Burkholderia latens]